MFLINLHITNVIPENINCNIYIKTINKAKYRITDKLHQHIYGSPVSQLKKLFTEVPHIPE